MKNQIKYSIIIPAYKEEAFIGSTLNSLQKYLKKTKLIEVTEVIVVTADSPDKTRVIAKSKKALFTHFNLIEPGKRAGKGRDVRAGMLAARGRYVLFTDADLATPLHHISAAWKLLENSSDVVVGVRDLEKINKSFHRGLGKYVSVASSYIARLLIVPGINDTQCGFKCFTKEAAAIIFNNCTIDGWAFDMEVLALARQKKFSISIHKIHDWQENRPYNLQLSGDNRLAAAVVSFIEVMKIKFSLLVYKYAESVPAVSGLPVAYLREPRDIHF